MRQSIGLYYGDRLLTEVIADTEQEAREKAVANDTVVTICKRPEETPLEYRQKVARSRAVVFPRH